LIRLIDQSLLARTARRRNASWKDRRVNKQKVNKSQDCRLFCWLENETEEEGEIYIVTSHWWPSITDGIGACLSENKMNILLFYFNLAHSMLPISKYKRKYNYLR
jgi:hypothetical protein